MIDRLSGDKLEHISFQNVYKNRKKFLKRVNNCYAIVKTLVKNLRPFSWNAHYHIGRFDARDVNVVLDVNIVSG